MKPSRTLLSLVLIGLLASNAQAEDLTQVYSTALQHDPQLRAAEADLQAVRQATKRSRSLYLPSLDLGASSTRSSQETRNSSGLFANGTSDFTTTGYSLNLRQAIYRRDYYTQLKQAGAAQRQAEAQYQGAQQALILRVASHYFDVLAARDALDFAESEKSAIARQLEQTKQRFEVGLIAITDVHEAQAAFDMATAGEITARNGVNIARQALQEITSLLPESLSPLNDEMPLISPDPDDITQWVANAEAQNFSLIAAEASTEVAQQQLSQRRSDRHPTVDLVASHVYNDVGGGTFGSRETEDSSVSLQLNVPLFRGGGINAGVREARYQLTSVRERLEQTRRAVQRETRDAYLTVQASISQVKALKQAVVSTQSALNATEAGFDVGTRTTVDVLNSRRELFRAQRNYARARYDYILAGLRLKQAGGLLAASDLEQINAWLN